MESFRAELHLSPSNRIYSKKFISLLNIGLNKEDYVEFFWHVCMLKKKKKDEL